MVCNFARPAESYGMKREKKLGCGGGGVGGGGWGGVMKRELQKV